MWSQQGDKLVGTGAVGGASEGWSVALSADGNTAIVGGLCDNGCVGAAWVFVSPVPTTGLNFAGSMAQVASGGDWDTTLILTNTGGVGNQAQLNFFDNNGSLLQLPFTFPQATSSTSPLVTSTLDRMLNSNSLLVAELRRMQGDQAAVSMLVRWAESELLRYRRR